MEVDGVEPEGNVPLADTESTTEVSKSPENPPVEDVPSNDNKSEDEPPAKKSKVAEEALRKIEAAKLLKEKEKQEAETKAKNDRKKELTKFWKTVKDDPTDFTGWTHLLQFVDSKNVLDEGEEAFNAFLKRYPYCYGYWKKFADFEKRNGTPEKVMEVFAKGTSAIPLSTDLWIHFMNHCKAVKKEEPDFIRSQYERAMTECGKEWRSDKLWDHYVKWEMEEKNLPEVFQLYQRMLKIPTHGLSRNLEAFIAFMKEQNPKDLMDTVDFLTLRKEIISQSNAEGNSIDDGAAPGEDTENDLKSAEETMAMKERIVFDVKKVFKDTEDKVKLRLKYEEGIKRPYFHVKPLERGQLKNWNDYIEFMKAEMSKEGGDLSEVEILYERSLIACALYEEFWMNYISWWESREGDNIEKIRSIYSRACTNHLPTKVDLHEQWAAFEECKGDSEAASKVLENLEKAHPELISLILRRINLERRRGNHEKVSELYEAAIKAAPNKSVGSDLSVKYARYLRLHQRDLSQAGQVIKTALDSDPANPKLYLQHLDILINTLPMDVPQVVSLLEKAMVQEEMQDKHKILFSQRKVEFLEDFGSDISALLTAKTKHEEFLTKVKEADKTGEEGPGGEKNGSSNGSTASYPPVTNSSTYTAQQAQAYNNYGSRYATYPQNYSQQYGGAGY